VASDSGALLALGMSSVRAAHPSPPCRSEAVPESDRCTDAAPLSSPRSGLDALGLRRFGLLRAELGGCRVVRHYALYYVGGSHGGLPLTFSGRGPGDGEGLRRSWSFIYGDCEPAASEGGCAPPLEVQNWSICTRFPALYPGPTPATRALDGAETLPAGGGLDVYTGRTTVVIFGRRRHRDEIVGSLVRVGAARTPAKLPPPVPGALEGSLPCQQQLLDRLGG
jgi:hypothetical protein